MTDRPPTLIPRVPSRHHLEPLERVAPPHLASEVGEGVDEQSLVAALLEHRDLGRYGETPRQAAELDPAERARPTFPARPRSGRTLGEHPVDESELVVQLHRARLHGECARFARRPLLAVDDERVDAELREGHREHQPAGAGTDDEHVGRDLATSAFGHASTMPPRHADVTRTG